MITWCLKVIGVYGALIERRRQSGGRRLAQGSECSIARTLLSHSNHSGVFTRTVQVGR
jgi:hypothetical protein